MSRSVRQYSDAEQLATAAASSLILKINELLALKPVVHISLTGGTVGILTLKKLGLSDAKDSIDWSRVHIWWGDERFVASDSADRNANQANDALLSKIDIPSANIHEFPSSDGQLDLASAASQFAKEVNRYVKPEQKFLGFDVTLLGMGPDGHVASLFAEKPLPQPGISVIAESDSPKPPPMRLSFSYEAINASDEIWFVVSGADKAAAVEVAFSDDPYRLPVGRISAQQRTVWFIDHAAAQGVDFSEIAE